MEGKLRDITNHALRWGRGIAGAGEDEDGGAGGEDSTRKLPQRLNLNSQALKGPTLPLVLVGL